MSLPFDITRCMGQSGQLRCLLRDTCLRHTVPGSDNTPYMGLVCDSRMRAYIKTEAEIARIRRQWPQPDPVAQDGDGFTAADMTAAASAGFMAGQAASASKGGDT